MSVIYDPTNKTWYNSDYADSTVKARGITVSDFGVMPGQATTSAPVSSPQQTYQQPQQNYGAPVTYQANLNPNDVNYYRTQIQQGLIKPTDALTQLQGKIAAPTGRETDPGAAYNAYNQAIANSKNQLYAPLSGVYDGRQFNLNPDGTQTYTTPYMSQTTVGGMGASTTTNAVNSYIQAGANPQQAQALAQNLPQTQNYGFNPTRNLEPGMQGADVTGLQNFLIQQGYSIPDGATGYYGPQTKAAVAQWQKNVGINAGSNYGFFGPLSMAYMKGHPIAGQTESTSPALGANPTSEYPNNNFQINPTGTATSDAIGSGATKADVLSKVQKLYDTYTNLQQQLVAKQSEAKNLETQALQEITTARGEPIPLGLIGQQEQLIKENLAFRQMPLENQIQTLTQQLGIQEKLIEMSKPTSVGSGQSLVDPMTGQVIYEGQSPIDKQSQDTVFNLAQTYPDANIAPTDTLQVAQQKAANSPSFAAKNTSLRSVVDPVNGGITYYDAKGNAVYHAGSNGQITPVGGGVTAPGNSTGGGITSGPQPIPSIIQPAIGKIGSAQYIDMSKLTTGQIPTAQRISASNGIPLLTKEDVNAIQLAYQTHQSATKNIDTITSLSSKLITASNGVESITQAAKINFDAATKSNSDAAVFKSTINAFLSSLSRAAGEKGVLTDFDVARIKAALPNEWDTKASAQGKIATLKTLFENSFQSAVDAYANQRIGDGSNNDPLGIR